MALAIGVTPGNKIRIGQSILHVQQVVAGEATTVSIDGGPQVLITEDKRTEILPTVFVQLGKFTANAGSSSSRLAFEAPRDIVIRKVQLKLGPKVQEVMDHYHISVNEVSLMVQRAAKTSMEGGNRKFHQWLFDVHDEEVVAMRKASRPVEGEDRGAGVKEYECPLCQGWGCQECGWWGKVQRYL